MTQPQPASSPFRPLIFIAFVFVVVASLSVVGKLRIPAEQVTWREDIVLAQQESRQSGKPVVLYFTANWCQPCQEMRREVWTDSKVASAMKRYVPVRIDIDRGGDIAERFNVRAIPLIAIIDDQGNVTRSINRGVSADELITWLTAK